MRDTELPDAGAPAAHDAGGARAAHRTSATCLNCGAAEAGDFCARCGQKNTDLRAPLRELASEVAEEALGLDSRLRHTFAPFFTRPGFLTAEYNRGRRARYTSPLKLYLGASVIFFLAVNAFGTRHEVVQVAGPVQRNKAAGAPAESWNTVKKEVQDKNALLRWIVARAAALEQEGPGAAQRKLQAAFLDTVQKAPIVLVPVFALLLLGFYWRRGYFVDHLVFALHFHAFAFLAIALGLFAAALLPEKIGTPLLDATVVLAAGHLFAALRRVHGESRLRTALKLFGLAILYLAAFAVVLFGVVLVALALA